MKKTVIFIIGAVLGMLAAIGIYMFTAGDVAWATYLDEKLIPNATVVGSAIVAIYIAAQPVASKVMTWLTTVANNFKDATVTLEEAKAEEEARYAMLKSTEEAYKNALERLDATRAEMETYMSGIQHTAKAVEEMVRTGFGHMDELVSKGYAAKIERIYDDDNKEQIKD